MEIVVELLFVFFTTVASTREANVNHYVAQPKHIGTWVGVNQVDDTVKFSIKPTRPRSSTGDWEADKHIDESYQLVYEENGKTKVKAIITPHLHKIDPQGLVYNHKEAPELVTWNSNIQFMVRGDDNFMKYPLQETGHSMNHRYRFFFDDLHDRLFVKLPMDLNDIYFVDKYEDYDERERQFRVECNERIDISEERIYEDQTGHLRHVDPYVLVLTKQADGVADKPATGARTVEAHRKHTSRRRTASSTTLNFEDLKLTPSATKDSPKKAASAKRRASSTRTKRTSGTEQRKTKH